MTVIGERMLDLRQVPRVFDTKPWSAHLYVTEQCNLDCHYCNEFNNSIPHPALADLKKWMDHIRKLGVMRLGLQGANRSSLRTLWRVGVTQNPSVFGKGACPTTG